MKFSIGYNHDLKLLDLLDIYKANIEALYFPIPEYYLGTGRQIPQSKGYINQIPRIIAKCNSLNITPQLLLNATYEGKLGLTEAFFKNVLNYIKRLKDAGLKSLVITNPIYISRIRKEISDIRIESSVNCYVKTVEHALYLKDLGVDVLTIDRDINRNIPLIKEIKDKTGLKIRMMLNEGCLSNCPYRIGHYNYLSTRCKLPKKPIENVFMGIFCIEVYLKNPLKLFRIPFIPPDALDHYGQFIDYYKLSTRVFPTPRINLCLKAYIDKHFNGNLLTILDSPGLSYFEYVDYDMLTKSNFFEKMLPCNLKCDECGYCNALFKKAVLINRNTLNKRNKEEEKKVIRLYKKDLKTSFISGNRAQDYAKIGEAYFKLNRYRQAIKNIRRALKLNYQGSGAYSILGFCYENLENYTQAIKALRKEEKINPKDRSVNLALARCYRAIGATALFEKEINKSIGVLTSAAPAGSAGRF
jgi:tetratricopeptide (TPR) repeat protein